MDIIFELVIKIHIEYVSSIDTGMTFMWMTRSAP
jgi:hypothetical protein